MVQNPSYCFLPFEPVVRFQMDGAAITLVGGLHHGIGCSHDAAVYILVECRASRAIVWANYEFCQQGHYRQANRQANRFP